MLKQALSICGLAVHPVFTVEAMVGTCWESTFTKLSIDAPIGMLCLLRD